MTLNTNQLQSIQNRLTLFLFHIPVTEMKSEQPKLLVLQHANLENPLKVCNFWLRDHCRCDECYAADTFQRKFNILDVPLDIKPKHVIADENGLINIKCK